MNRSPTERKQQRRRSLKDTSPAVEKCRAQLHERCLARIKQSRQAAIESRRAPSRSPQASPSRDLLRDIIQHEALTMPEFTSPDMIRLSQQEQEEVLYLLEQSLEETLEQEQKRLEEEAAHRFLAEQELAELEDINALVSGYMTEQ